MLRESLATESEALPAVPALQAQLVDTRSRIARLLDVLAAGADDLPSVRTALVGLEREAHRLEGELARARRVAVMPSH